MQITKKTPRTSFVIQGVNFMIAQPFAEGYVLKPNEAAAMNQLLAENVRNNMAKAVKTEVEKAGSVENADVAALQEAVDKYTSDYEFGARIGGRTSDPVERKARDIATTKVREAIKAQGVKISDVPTDKINELAQTYLDQHKDAIYSIAKSQVEAEQALAGQITLGELPSKADAAVAEAAE